MFPNLQLCKWGLFCPPGMLRHSFGCSLVPWIIFVIQQDCLFPLREEIQGTGWWLPVGGSCSCTEAVIWACWQCPACCNHVKLNLVPERYQKPPKKSQCFLLTPCNVTFAHTLHHTPSVLSRIWTTNKFQNQFEHWNFSQCFKRTSQEQGSQYSELSQGTIYQQPLKAETTC